MVLMGALPLVPMSPLLAGLRVGSSEGGGIGAIPVQVEEAEEFAEVLVGEVQEKVDAGIIGDLIADDLGR